MATALSNITQNRAQALVGNIDATLPGEYALFALERGKRAIIDVVPATMAAVVIYYELLNAGTWSITHLPFVVLAVLVPYAFWDGRWI